MKKINEIHVNKAIEVKKTTSGYKIPIYKKTSLKINNSYVGERIEEKIRRITTQKEPIKDGAPIIYTERKNGVQPEYNIRTDRFELAIDAMDKYAKSITAERQSREKTDNNESVKTPENNKIDKIEP